MKHFYKFFLPFLFPFFSVAQSNYKPGYVVTLKGDTLHGFIDYKAWDKNPNYIGFKSILNNNKTETVSVQNASSFAVSGLEYYQRFVLSISQDQVDINKLSSKLDTSSLKDTVFLRSSSKGDHLNLFSYTDDIKTRFYILETGQTEPQELIYHVFYNADASSAMQYVNEYRSQLEYLAQKFDIKNSRLSKQILQARYTEPELIKIAQAINGSSSQAFTSNSLGGSRWFIGAGVNFSSLRFIVPNGTSFGGGSISNSSSVSPKITGGIDILLNKSVQNLMVRIGYSFTFNQYSVSNSNSGTPSSTSSLKLSQYNNSITPQIIFNFYNKQDLKVFIGAGAALNFSTYNHYQYITTYGGAFPDKIQDGYPAFSSFWLALPVQVGVNIKNKIEISVGYVPSSSLTSDNSTQGNVTSFQAGVNYLFGAK